MARVVRQQTADGDAWIHFSPKGKGKYRLLTEDGLSDLPDDFVLADNFAEELTQKQIADLIDSNFPRHKNSNEWSKIFSKLRAGDHHQCSRLDADQIIVPITRLREFRYSFSSWTMQLKRGQAFLFSEKPELLKELWQLSVSKLAEYRFVEPFFPAGQRKDLSETPTVIAEIRRTPQAQAYFKHKFCLNTEVCGMSLTYLDREIAPLRTPGGQFSGGQPATSTGCGGADLLLINRNRICVGEIKIRDDSELFDALLQGLWYASELATENQIERIKSVYSDKLYGVDLNDSGIDVVILSIDQKASDPTRKATIELVNWINEFGAFNRLGTVHLLENHGDDWRPIQ